MTEEWRPVSGWPAYEVSSLGRVRSKDRILEVRKSGNDRNEEHVRSRGGRVLAPRLLKQGYFTVLLYHAGKSKTALISRLVCGAFHGASPSPDYHVDHIDGVRGNNRPENLRWLAPDANRAARNCARGECHPHAKLTASQVAEIRSRAVLPRLDKEIAAEFGVTRETIRNIRRGHQWTEPKRSAA